MRIAAWHNLPTGGGLRAAELHLRGLAERGHHIEVWTPSTAASLDPSIGIIRHTDPSDRRIASPSRGARAVNAALQRRRLHRWHQAHARRVADEIAAGDFDVALLGSCRHLAIPLVSSQLSGRLPVCAYLGEPLRRLYEADPALPWMGPEPGSASARQKLAWLLVSEVERRVTWSAWRAAHGADLVLVNSIHSVEAFSRAYGITASTCYLGVDADFFAPSESVDRDGFVVCLGELERHKRPELALRAVAQLPASQRRLRWIANRSNPDLAERCRRIAADHSIDFEVLLAPDDTSVVHHLRRAGAFLYTSRLEPFGLALVEAMAVETPVVTVNEGGPREIVRDGVDGLLAPASPAALGSALERALDPGLARRLGTAAREAVLVRWTKELAVDRLERFLQTLLGSHGYETADIDGESV